MREYRPADMSVIVNGQIISGFAEGTFITVERDEEAYTYAPSTSGEGTRVKNANKAGKITIVLNQTSPSNQVFSDALKADEQNNQGVFPVLIRDNSGTDVHKSEAAYISKFPSTQYAKENSTREYVIQCENLDMSVGGNPSL